jgi:hypothetical protein
MAEEERNGPIHTELLHADEAQPAKRSGDNDHQKDEQHNNEPLRGQTLRGERKGRGWNKGHGTPA